MSIASLLGQFAVLQVKRILEHGAYLAEEVPESVKEDVVLLPRSEIKEEIHVDDRLRVFIYLDSKDRPVASLLTPKLIMGEVAFLTVKDFAPFGTFFDWGLIKDLFVPEAEQTQPLRQGESYALALYVDKTGRLAGTMKVSERLLPGGPYTKDQWVPGECWRRDPVLGTFVILEKKYVGLLPVHEVHSLKKGEAADFRIAMIREDGKFILSLRKHAHEELEGDAQKILDYLKNSKTARIGDFLTPEQIKVLFGISKKAFKRAVGTLLKKNLVRMDEKGILNI